MARDALKLQYRPSTKCSTPAAASRMIDCMGTRAMPGSEPLTSAATKNSGTPMGTLIESACNTEPVSTPRRALALLKAKMAAEKTAKKTPSTCPQRFIYSMSSALKLGY